MNRSFTITQAEIAASDAETLRATILALTGNDREAASIMRSLDRMGADPSILFFEMTEVSANRHYAAAPGAWRVRADRGLREEDS
jgi:hypothetical protein